MTNQEIAKLLNTTVEKVEAVTKDMGDINASMIPAIKAKLEGGKMTAPAPSGTLATTSAKEAAPLATATQKGAATKRRSSKMKAADEATALARVESTQAITTQVQETQKPQHLEAIEANASDTFADDTAVTALTREFDQEVDALTMLLNPEMRAMLAIQTAQAIANKNSQVMREGGLTVDAIVNAAIPKRAKVKSLQDIMTEKLAAHGISATAIVGETATV
jgi:hypothetical protein